MAMEFTQQQKQAIEARGNCIVSAAAGAGKTAVLTERVLRLVLAGESVEHMLILTFTKAAAGEMKGRIQKRLQEAAAMETGERKKHLLRQALICPNAQISTIHAFCARVLERHYPLLELSPGSKPLDEAESRLLLQQAIREAMTRYAQEEPASYKELLWSVSSRQVLEDSLEKLHLFLCAQPQGRAWLEEARAALEASNASQRIEQAALREAKRQLTLAKRGLELGLRKLDNGMDKVAANLLSVLETAQGLLEQESFEDYRSLLHTAVFPALRFPKGFDEELKEQIKGCRDDIKECMQEQQELFLDFLPSAKEQALLIRLFTLQQLTETLYEQRKQDRERMDFSDLEHLCAKALSHPQVAEEYRKRFAYIIVDEYQDSNRVQEQILNAIKREDNLFFVGDVKQSIYGFRMAEPGLFLEKLESFQGERGQRQDLSCNFRSSLQVLDKANSLFSRLMGRGMGAVVYDASAYLRPGGSPPSGKVELHLIEGASQEGLSAPQGEARFCGEKIRELLEKGCYTEPGGGSRPFRYNDFAILLRSTTQASVFMETLRYMGIPAYAQLSGGYFDSLEVMLFLNLLKVIDNRRQDIPLLSVMLSSIGNFSHEELIALRCQCPKGELLDCLLLDREQRPEGKAAGFLSRIEGFRQMSLRMGVEELLTGLLEQTGFLRDMGALPGGKQRRNNVLSLLERARSYEQGGAWGLHGFIRFMELSRDTDRSGAAQTVNSNAVRILTVHKSKGLEFPVVFLCQLGKRFNRQDRQEALLLDGSLGAALRYVDKERYQRVSQRYKGLRMGIAQRQMEEEQRVLYVAMTRPRQELYLVGSVKEGEKFLQKLPVDRPYGLWKADSYLKWIAACLKEELPVEIHPIGELSLPKRTDKPQLPVGTKAQIQALSRRFSWEYPYSVHNDLPYKTSVTALAQKENKEAVFEEPSFMQQGESALSHGSSMHALLQHLPLQPTEALLSPLVASLSSYDAGCLRWFMGTELFKRMGQSPLCRRELPFMASVEARKLGYEGTEPVLLQGVVDVCFREEEAWVLLDYKTDRFRGRSPKEAAAVHVKQLQLYKELLEALTGKKVKESYIVFISEREIVAL